MRLEITRKSDLAVRILRELQQCGARMKGPQLAAAVDSTPGYVPHVITPLARAGWVRSEPGPTGGYQLVADLGDVSVLQVIEAVEGPTESGWCVLADRLCDAGDRCALHLPWSQARDGLLAELAQASVADAIPGRGSNP